MAFLWICVFLMIIPSVSSQDVRTHCFTDSQTSAEVDFSCPDGFTIAIQDVLYGSNSYKECTYTSDTCTEHPRDVNKTECLGKQHCSLTARRMYSVDCGGYVNFFRVIYECFPVFVARNYTFGIPQTTTNVPRPFGINPSIRNSPADKTNGMSIGMILAIVGCVLGTIYICVVIVILSLLLRRSNGKRDLANDEEQPSEADNTGFKSSNNGIHGNNGAESQHREQATAVDRDSNRNIVSRPGPDGRELSTEVFVESDDTPTSRVVREKNNYNNNIQHGSSIVPKSLFTKKDSISLSENPSDVSTESRQSGSTNEVSSNC